MNYLLKQKFLFIYCLDFFCLKLPAQNLMAMARSWSRMQTLRRYDLYQTYCHLSRFLVCHSVWLIAILSFLSIFYLAFWFLIRFIRLVFIFIILDAFLIFSFIDFFLLPFGLIFLFYNRGLSQIYFLSLFSFSEELFSSTLSCNFFCFFGFRTIFIRLSIFVIRLWYRFFLPLWQAIYLHRLFYFLFPSFLFLSFPFLSFVLLILD